MEKDTGANQGKDEERKTEEIADGRSRALRSEPREVDRGDRAGAQQRAEAEAYQDRAAIRREAIQERRDEQRNRCQYPEEDVSARLRDVDQQQMRDPENGHETAEGSNEQ